MIMDISQTAGETPDAPVEFAADGVTVSYDAGRCLHFGECVRGLPSVFDLDQQPWIQPGKATVGEVAAVVRRCPSGALKYQIKGGPPEEPEPVTTVTQLPGGPLLLRGNLQIQRPAAEQQPTDKPAAAETEARMAACSCGRTARAPFCDGRCQPAS